MKYGYELPAFESSKELLILLFYILFDSFKFRFLLGTERQNFYSEPKSRQLL